MKRERPGCTAGRNCQKIGGPSPGIPNKEKRLLIEQAVNGLVHKHGLGMLLAEAGMGRGSFRYQLTKAQ